MKKDFLSKGVRIVALALMVMFVMSGDLQAQAFKFYRGFCDGGVAAAPSPYRDGLRGSFVYGYFSTTHGYYVGDRTFVGVGAGLTFDEELLTLPLFAAVKYNLSFTQALTPTFELRVGTYFDLWDGERASLYGDAAAGLRWALDGRVALNMLLHVTYQQGFCQIAMLPLPVQGGGCTDWGCYTESLPLSIGARIGLEF